jgi:hypothetical protein
MLTGYHASLRCLVEAYNGDHRFDNKTFGADTTWRKKSRRRLLVLIVLGISANPARSGSLRVEGTAGYLSECQLGGDVAERRTSAGIKELFGPLTWKHVGLCSPNGPEEKRGEIRIRLFGSGASGRMRATLSLENAQCSYTGIGSDGSTGLMDCSDARGVPLTLSFK